MNCGVFIQPFISQKKLKNFNLYILKKKKNTLLIQYLGKGAGGFG